MNILVFDMDDTLYDEYNYVKSGFKAVANNLSHEMKIDSDEIFQWMWNRLQEKGRGKVFNDLLLHYGVFTKARVKKCLMIYRTHKPDICLPKDSIDTLNLLREYTMYLVTDGNKVVQAQKIEALNLDRWMKKCFITHRYGLKHSKPSPYCLERIAEMENLNPIDIVYIGDNPRKDFIGIRQLGFRSIRIMTGQHKGIEMPTEYEAEIRCQSISELPKILKEMQGEKA